MAETIEELKNELASYKADGVIGYYYQLNKWVNDTVDLMRTKTVKSLLSTSDEDKDAKKFERMMTLIKNTKEWIDTIESIRGKIIVTGDEIKDTQTPIFRITTPESISDVLGNTAGQIH